MAPGGDRPALDSGRLDEVSSIASAFNGVGRDGRAGMVDRIGAAARSALMARVSSRDTAPEMAVRRVAHRLGLRFRIHRADLPGTPDLVFPRYRTVVFVHGCFWHRHERCKRCTTPATRPEFWEAKFRRDVERDAAALQALGSLGWRTLVVWECRTRDDGYVVEVLSSIRPRG